jgi:hypothetical protein
MVAAVAGSAATAGLASVGYCLVTLDPSATSFRALVPVAVVATIATFSGGQLVSSLRLQRIAHRSARDLEARSGASAEAIREFGVPLDTGVGSFPSATRKTVALGALLSVCLLALALASPASTGVGAVLIVAVAVGGGVALNRYLGWRPRP